MVVIPTRVRVVVVVVSALAAGLLTLALLAKPTQAQAETGTFSAHAPLDSGIVNPCTGELVFLEGFGQFVSHATIDENGGHHLKMHVTLHGQGVSASGAKYVWHESFNQYLYFSPEESADNITLAVSFRVIRQGSATPEDDFIGKAVVHFTRNANGEVTAEVIKVEPAECK